MRDVGLNLCDFFPKLFEFFRIFGDGCLVYSTASSILRLPFGCFTGFKSRTLPCCFLLLVLFRVLRILFHNFGCSNMESHVSGYQAANRLIETVIAPNFCRDRSRLEFRRRGFVMIHAAQTTVGAV